MGMSVGTTLGGLVPILLGDHALLDGWTLLGGLIGGIVGVWLGVVVAKAVR